MGIGSTVITIASMLTAKGYKVVFCYIYMLHALTKPALMTFSYIEAINFYFNAKLTDFAMFSYQFITWLTYCPMYRDYETHSYLLLHIP